MPFKGAKRLHFDIPFHFKLLEVHLLAEHIPTMIKAFICFILLVSAASVPASTRNQEKAANFHSQALDLVNQNQYDLALAHFRAACRSYNESALYWNDLGVTEMRMELYDLARTRFQKALSIDPSFELSIQNLNELDYFSPARKQSAPSVGNARRHKIMHPRELTHAEFVQLNAAFTRYPHVDQAQHEFVKSVLSEPFILKNTFNLFNITSLKLEAVLNRQFLTTTYGHHRVDFYPQNMLLENAHPYFLSLGSALRQLLYTPEEVYVGVDASAPGTYVQWNLDYDMWHDVLGRLGATLPEMLRDTWAEGCLSVSGGKSMSSGGSGVGINDLSSASTSVEGTRVDSDGVGCSGPQSIDTSTDNRTTYTTTTTTTSTTTVTTATLDTVRLSHFYLTTHWQMLLLAEAKAGMFLHKDTLRSASWQLQLVGRKMWHLCSDANTPYLYKAGDVDMFSVDYDRYPLVLRAECYEVVLNEGEMLYYPSDFWHQTVNLDTPSIAISSTLVTPMNYMHVKHVLLEQCYNHWAALYGVL